MVDWASGDYSVIAADLEPAAERVVDAARVGPGERVLDVGCGTGNAALAAHRRGADVTGVDSEQTLLAVAAARPGAAEVRWLEGDAVSLPVGDAQFDVVLSVFGVMFAGDAPAAVAELVRALAPGGRIGLANWIPEGPIAAAMSGLARAAGAPPRPRGPSWGDEEFVRALFEPHGLRVRAERHEVVFRGESADAWLDVQERASPPLQEPLARLRAKGTWDEVRAAARAAFEAANEAAPRFAVRSPWLLAVAAR